jgi:magnesium transporter
MNITDTTFDTRGQKAGLPPGSLVHVGKHSETPVRIKLVNYDEFTYDEHDSYNLEECLTDVRSDLNTWINLDGVHDVSLLEKIGDCFKIHPLVLEDILNTNQRPKIEDYGDYLYIVLKAIYYDDVRDSIDTEQISLIIGENYLISFQEKDGSEGDILLTIRERFRTNTGRLRKMGTDYLAYSIIDIIADHYFVVIEIIGDKIEILEEKAAKNPRPEIMEDIHELKRDIIVMRRTVWPLREVLGTYSRVETRLLKQDTLPYLRDVYDHTIQAVDMIEIYRDTISTLIDIYLSSVSYRLNEIMKLLTMISVIFIPLTFLAGVYGMNFEFMPELRSHYGYPGVWLVMIIIAVSMLIWFRRKNWL